MEWYNVTGLIVTVIMGGGSVVAILVAAMKDRAMVHNSERKEIDKLYMPYQSKLKELTDSYIKSARAGSESTDRTARISAEFIEWQKEYDEALNDAIVKELAASGSYDRTIAPGSIIYSREAELLAIIKAFTVKYGFDHPKTQRAVELHDDMFRGWR